jgi:hypothetical protein
MVEIMAKRILTLGNTTMAGTVAQADIEREEPPSVYSTVPRRLKPRLEEERVVVDRVEMGFGGMVSLAIRWVLAYLLAIALLAAIGGLAFVVGRLLLRAVS